MIQSQLVSVYDWTSPDANIVVLTGAGVSAESGLKTFRDNDGLWENHRVEEVATPEGFSNNPDLVYRFYNQRRAQLLEGDVAPNRAHIALAEFEKQHGGGFLLITQNVDDLHERAGSKNLLHMHGQLMSARCLKSGQSVYTQDSFDQRSQCSCCQPAQGIRPDIVWFGEMPMFMEDIFDALSQADLFIAVGTSGNVYPAAGFVEQAAYYGAKTIELNLEPSLGQSHFNAGFYGMASAVVPQFFNTRNHAV